MAESRQRASFQSSSSSSASSSSNPFGNLPASGSYVRPLKRRYADTTEDPFLTTPNPSQPTASSSLLTDSSRRFPSTSRGNPPLSRQASLGVAHLPTLDPTEHDPDAIFIHPPFIDFPDAHLYKDGLTYNLMAVNPNWFLDPKDYITTVNSLEGAIRYPPQLEPPRGWCPSKKKDSIVTWPEGEEPRLRCTFCRRTYAGVNAKSMWRRHVYEKHKIAMSNRRDNNDRSKGRGQNKENSEREQGRNRRGGNAPPEASSGVKHPYRQFSTGQSKDPPTAPPESDPPVSEPEPSPQDLQKESDALDAEIDSLQIPTSSSTPPLTPGASPSTSFFLRPDIKDIPESPYNPLLTPAFRHSPARLPSDQPWRFPSPSHPLHSSAQELSLSMLVHGEASPLVSGLDVSPLVIVPKSARRKRSMFSSPFAAPPEHDRDVCSDGEGSDLPRRAVKPTPRKLIYEGSLPTPFTDRIKFGQHRVPESPLGRTFFGQKSKNLSAVLHANSAWRTPAKSPLGKGLMDPIQLDEDPFMLYKPFNLLHASPSVSTPLKLTPPSSSSEMETDSPVLRSSQLSNGKPISGVGLGIGLMEGFSLKTPSSPTKMDDVDELMFASDGKEGDLRMQLADGSPAPLAFAGRKNRRLIRDLSLSECDSPESSQPKKRRRTLSGRD